MRFFISRYSYLKTILIALVNTNFLRQDDQSFVETLFNEFFKMKLTNLLPFFLNNLIYKVRKK